MLKPIPPYFQVTVTQDEAQRQVFAEVSKILGFNVAALPRHRTEAFVEEVFGSMFDLFPRRTVLLARDFKSRELQVLVESYMQPICTELIGLELYWNEELKAGVIHANSPWIDQVGKWERPAIAGLSRHIILPVKRS